MLNNSEASESTGLMDPDFLCRLTQFEFLNWFGMFMLFRSGMIPMNVTVGLAKNVLLLIVPGCMCRINRSRILLLYKCTS